jgi:hypothetical protein
MSTTGKPNVRQKAVLPETGSGSVETTQDSQREGWAEVWCPSENPESRHFLGSREDRFALAMALAARDERTESEL